VNTASAARVPAIEDDQGVAPTGRKMTTNWVEQFFGASAVFNSAATRVARTSAPRPAGSTP